MAMSAAAAGIVFQLTIVRTFPKALVHCLHTRRSVLLSKPLWTKRFSPAVLQPNSKPCQQSALIARSKMVAVETAMETSTSPSQQHDLPASELGYFQDMFALQSTATFLALVQEGDRLAVILDRTILYPQGGGQPCDTGYISTLDEKAKFRVEDVRARNGLVYHYGNFDSSKDTSFQQGQEVLLAVDASRRSQNSRLHSAGHLLDACMKIIGLNQMEPGKGHHFPDSPFVEYKGTIPAADIETKRAELEGEANRLVKMGGLVQAVVAPYEEAADLCGGSLPTYIAKESRPRIVTVGGLGCPCGGTHVANISEIGSIKVTQIRVKKGTTKVSYTITADIK